MSSPWNNGDSYIPNSTHSNASFFSTGTGSNEFDTDELARTPAPPSSEVRARMLRPKTLVEKARMNVA